MWACRVFVVSKRECSINSSLSWSVVKTYRRHVCTSLVSLQIKPTETSPLNIFDKNTKKLQKERAILSPDVANFDYLKEEIGERLADRIFDIKRDFNRVLDLGCGRGYVSKKIVSDNVKELYCCDISSRLTEQASCDDTEVLVKKLTVGEERLSSAVEPESIDLVLSNLTLHWVNNLPLCFDEVIKILKKDGVFMAAIFGGDTLYELRSSLQLAELERLGGISPHISPFAQVRDIGGLLTRSGFTMQTIDTEEMVVWYPSMMDVMLDLKGMGESNAAWNRKLHLRRDIISAASAIYNQLYGKEESERFGVPATYQILFFLGWKPDPSQPKPLPRGSGEVSLKDLYRIDEIAKKKGKIETEDK